MTVSPPWFFTTIAQATAATIGFIIAIVTAVFVTKRARIRDQENRLDWEIDKLRQEYQQVLSIISNQVEGRVGGNQAPNTPIANEIRDSIEEIVYILENFQAFENSLQKQAKYDELLSKANGIEERITGANRELFDELSNNPSGINEYMEYPLFSGNAAIESWLQSEGYDVESGSLRSWVLIFTELAADIDNQVSPLIGQFDRNIGTEIEILERCLILFSVGVVLPLVFVISVPDSLPALSDWTVFIIEILILSGVFYYIIKLFDSLFQLVNDQT